MAPTCLHPVFVPSSKRLFFFGEAGEAGEAGKAGKAGKARVAGMAEE
jgi:hypothetical protein